jgi:hypothetical protein
MNSVTDPVTGQVQEYRHLVQGPTRTQWVTGLANEFGRLYQGVGKQMQHGTETIIFIRKADVPAGRKNLKRDFQGGPTLERQVETPRKNV